MSIESAVVLMAFALGAVCGSFLNVCIYRLPRACMRIDQPRTSICPACRAPIPIRFNVPIFGWLALRGRAACCGVRIPVRYPFVELLTALAFAGAAWLRVASGPMEFDRSVWLAGDIYLVAAIITLTYIDLDLHIIPDEISLFALPIGLGLAALAPLPQSLAHAPEFFGIAALDGVVAALLGALVGGGTLWAISKAWEIAFGQVAIGAGDVRLMLGFGAFLGWVGFVAALLFACLVAVLLAGVRFLVTRDRHLAFGPYLGLGTLIVRAGEESADLRFLGLVTWLLGDAETRGHPELFWTGMLVLVAFLGVFLLALRRDRLDLEREA